MLKKAPKWAKLAVVCVLCLGIAGYIALIIQFFQT